MNDLIIRKIEIKWDKIDKNSYLRQIKAIRNTNELEFNSRITFLVGENGSGKSTLLEAIAIAYGFNPEGGTINFNFSNYDDFSELYNFIRIWKTPVKYKSGYFFRAESFFNLATKSQEYSEGMGGGLPPLSDLHFQSHGESFLSFIQNYMDKGLYIMDEPEAALSPQRQLVLLAEIYKMAQNGSQFIIATHSPILLGTPGSEIISFEKDNLKKCSFENTDAYIVTKSFINNPEKILKELLE